MTALNVFCQQNNTTCTSGNSSLSFIVYYVNAHTDSLTTVSCIQY